MLPKEKAFIADLDPVKDWFKKVQGRKEVIVKMIDKEGKIRSCGLIDFSVTYLFPGF